MKEILIPSGSTLATFVYEKSSNLDGYEEMDKLTINEVKKILSCLVMERKIYLYHIGKIKILLKNGKTILFIKKQKQKVKNGIKLTR